MISDFPSFDVTGHARAEAAPPREAPAGGVRTMDQGELHHFLLRHRWGMLCTVERGIPYAVPVAYGFDGRYVYFASGPGRKRRNLESAPGVCFTVTDVEDGDRWSSVVVIGEAHPVSGVRGRLHALSTLHRQRSAGAPPSAADLARAARASVFRITPEEITGRSRG